MGRRRRSTLFCSRDDAESNSVTTHCGRNTLSLIAKEQSDFDSSSGEVEFAMPTQGVNFWTIRAVEVGAGGDGDPIDGFRHNLYYCKWGIIQDKANQNGMQRIYRLISETLSNCSHQLEFSRSFETTRRCSLVGTRGSVVIMASESCMLTGMNLVSKLKQQQFDPPVRLL